jgi:hypothetical protein
VQLGEAGASKTNDRLWPIRERCKRAAVFAGIIMANDPVNVAICGARMYSIEQYEIEAAAYNDFLVLWEHRAFEQQRLGQAFYNHFKLHSLANQMGLNQLYEATEREALLLISNRFLIR